MSARDRRKLLALLWMGRNQAPFLVIASLFQVVSAAIGTMEAMQCVPTPPSIMYIPTHIDSTRK